MLKRYRLATFHCSLPLFELQNKLSAHAQEILKKKFGESTTVHFDVCMEEGRGDLTSSIALQYGKKVGKKPQEVASTLVDGLMTIEGVQKVESAGPGFVNVFLVDASLTLVLKDVEESCTPRQVKKGANPIVVDYSQPNIAKPLGVHHILSTVIGQSLVNLYKHLGYATVSINHIGDWGTQFGKLAVAHQKWGKKAIEKYSIDELLELYVQFHTEAEKNPELEDAGRAAFKTLEDGDPTLRTFWSAVVTITMESMGDMYRRLHVHFDHTQGESFYEDKMAPIIDEGKKKGVFVQGKEGALIANFPEESKLPPAIVVKADGSTIYMTRDLATARYRIDTWHPSAILYVVDVAQQLYFQQLFATLGQLQWKLPTLEHVLFGRMRFSDKSMSTRKGNILKLEQVLDEAVARAEAVIAERGEKIQTDDPKELSEMIGVGSLVYGVLSQNRKMDMVFDWDKMLSFEGNSAPYLQYTHARAMSVLRKSGESNTPHSFSIKSLTTHERTLIKLLVQFGDTLESARADHLPHKVTVYLHDVCQAFNSFYAVDEILTSTGDTRALRISLASLTARVLKTGAEILTIRVPDRM